MNLALAALAGVFLFVGLLIGSVGIGGMFIVPSMVHLVDMNVHLAIATAMAGYLGSGGAGVIAFSRRGSIAWRQALTICTGAVPGAFLGAFTVVHVPGLLVETLIAALTLFSGLHALMPQAAQPGQARNLGVSLLVFIGLVVGFGSAMSGTGGPLILLPILMWLRVPILVALGAAHMSQVTIATCATVGNVLYSQIHVPMAIALALLLGLGVFAGVVVAHRVPADKLRRMVAVALVLTGIALFIPVIRVLVF